MTSDVKTTSSVPFSHWFYKAPIRLPASSLMSYHCGIKASSPDSFVSRQMGGWSTPSAWRSVFPALLRLPSTLLMRSLVSSTCQASLGVNTLPSSGLSGPYLWQTSGLALFTDSTTMMWYEVWRQHCRSLFRCFLQSPDTFSASLVPDTNTNITSFLGHQWAILQPSVSCLTSKCFSGGCLSIPWSLWTLDLSLTLAGHLTCTWDSSWGDRLDITCSRW